MAFEADWNPLNPPWLPELEITGFAKKYVIDWGDGTSETAIIHIPVVSGGYHGFSQAHQYADGEYTVSISQGGRGVARDNWHVIFATGDTVGKQIDGTGDADYILAGSGDDVVHGGRGNDYLQGADGDDLIVGGSGVDKLYGGSGDDRLSGGDGDDTLFESAGKDRLSGGDGHDTFTFLRLSDGATYLDSDPDRDSVVDFHQHEDKLDVSYLTDRHIAFIGEDTFSGSGHRHSEIRFFFNDAGDTIVEVDRDGNATADFSIRLVGHFDLTGADFVF